FQGTVTARSFYSFPTRRSSDLVEALLGGAAGRVTLNDIDFAFGRVFFLAIRQLSWQACAFKHAFATRHFASLASSVARTGGFNNLVAQSLGVVGVFKQPGLEGARYRLFNGRAHFAGNEFVFGLAAELGLGHFYRQHAGQAFTHVIAGSVDLGLLGQFVIGNVFIDDSRHGSAQ